MKKLASYHFFYLFVAVLLSIPIIFPYFHSGYFPTHDGEWAVVRLSEMYREVIRDHQFPARYSEYLNFGHGYPLFNFAYPFPYYVGLLFVVLGFGFVGSIKIMFATATLLSVIAMYCAANSIWKNRFAACISALLYAYFPYRMVDLYVRGSLGETIAFVLFPLLFYLTVKIVESKKPVLYIIGYSLSLAALIMAHNIMTVLFIPILVLFIVHQIFFVYKKSWKYFIGAFMGGLGLSAFFWVPAIFEKGNIFLSKVPIADRDLYYVNFLQLIKPSWSYGIPTAPDAFTYQLGIAHILVFIVATCVAAYGFMPSSSKSKKELYLPIGLVVIITGLILMMMRPFSFVWNLPLLSEINYPWTLLAPLGFLMSLLVGFLATRQKILKYLALVAAVLSIIICLPYAHPSMYTDLGDTFYSTNDATTTSSSELMPLWVVERPNHLPPQKIELINSEGNIENISFNSRQVAFKSITDTEGLIRVNTIYYPGWKAFVNGKEVKIDYSNKKGVMDISVPSGENTIELLFRETPLRAGADGISIITAFGLIAYLLYNTLRFSKKYEN